MGLAPFPIWATLANAALYSRYLITFEISDRELFERWYDRSPEDAAEAYAEKYDLEPAPEPLDPDDYLDLFRGNSARFLPGEARATGNGGIVFFCAFTGLVTRHFPSDEVPFHHEGYYRYRRLSAPDIEPGDVIDVIYAEIELWDGTIEPPCEQNYA